MALAGAAHAEPGPPATVQLAASEQPDSDLAATGASSPVAPLRISISRAGDAVGSATFFSRSLTVGTGSAVVVSSRKGPANSVFSVDLTPPPALSLSRSLGGPATMPSLMPVATSAISSSFGWRRNPYSGLFQPHRGVDLPAPYGTPIVATMDGTVVASGLHGGYGLLVSLDNASGVETRYGHMSRLAVSQGQQVRKGEVIGYVGSTGHSTGPHVHYEIRVGGEPINPARYLHNH